MEIDQSRISAPYLANAITNAYDRGRADEAERQARKRAAQAAVQAAHAADTCVQKTAPQQQALTTETIYEIAKAAVGKNANARTLGRAQLRALKAVQSLPVEIIHL